MIAVSTATFFFRAASSAAWAMASLTRTVVAKLLRNVAGDCIHASLTQAFVMLCASFTIGAKNFFPSSRLCAGLHMSWKPFTRRARWTRADLRICHLRCERKVHKKISKLESQPRTHKGATREANTTATQNSAPLSTGLSMMFETLPIYPGHLKGLHDHTSKLCFQKMQP